MLDIVKLDESLKLRSLGRLLATTHPYMSLIKERLDLGSFFNPLDTVELDKIASMGIELLRQDRSQLWEINQLTGHRQILQAIGDLSLKEVVSERGRNSIPFFLLWRANLRLVRDLTIAKLTSIRRYIDPKKIAKIENCIRTNSRGVRAEFQESYLINSQPKHLSKLTSKEFRESRAKLDVIKEFKIGMQLNQSEGLSWGLKLSKVSSTKHKNILLRVAHGDIYTKEKLHRFGMIDNLDCPRCGQVEDLNHKFMDCIYAKKIWDVTLNSTGSILTINPGNEPRIKAIMGGYIDSSPASLTLNAEILHRLLMLKEDSDYLIHPKQFVKNATIYLLRKEKKREIKEHLKSIQDSIGG